MDPLVFSLNCWSISSREFRSLQFRVTIQRYEFTTVIFLMKMFGTFYFCLHSVLVWFILHCKFTGKLISLLCVKSLQDSSVGLPSWSWLPFSLAIM